MAFTQQPLNYAAEYSRALANAYPYLSYFGEVWASPNSTLYRPGNAKTVYIPSMTVSGARNVNRDRIDGTFNRNFNNEYQPVTLQMDREWDTLVDPMDIQESNEVATIANITRTFNEFQKIPEMDAYAASKLAGFASGFGGVDSTALTGQNILAQWDSYLVYMTNQRIGRDRLVAYMTPDTYKLLKEAAGITRFVQADSGIRNVDRNVGRLDGVTIKEVPGDQMQSAYDFTVGWAPAAGAKQINMLLLDPLSVIAPVIYETSMMSAPTAQSKGKWLYYERYYYDVFALNNRMAGFFANMSAPALGALTVTSAAGSAAGSSVITASGAGLGLYGTETYITTGNDAAPTLTYGAELPSGATWAVMPGNPATLTGLTAGKYATVAVVNKQTGGVIAGGSAVQVVKA